MAKKIGQLALTILFATVTTAHAASPAKPATHAKAALPAKSATPSNKADIPGWLLKQRVEYHGPCEVRATGQGCKVRTKDLVLFLEPKKDGTVLNETNKTITTISRSMWTNRGALKTLTKDAPPDILKKYKIPLSPPKLIAGHKCTQHWATVYFADHRFAWWYEYWTTNDITLPKDVQDDYLAMLRIPSSIGVPLEATRHLGKPKNPTHTRVVTLSTSEVKPIKVAAAELVPPTTGYRKVADEMDMFLSTEQDDDIEKVLSEQGKAK